MFLCYSCTVEYLEHRPHGPQSLKYLLSCPGQKKYTDSWDRLIGSSITQAAILYCLCSPKVPLGFQSTVIKITILLGNVFLSSLKKQNIFIISQYLSYCCMLFSAYFPLENGLSGKALKHGVQQGFFCCSLRKGFLCLLPPLGAWRIVSDSSACLVHPTARLGHVLPPARRMWLWLIERTEKGRAPPFLRLLELFSGWGQSPPKHFLSSSSPNLDTSYK